MKKYILLLLIIITILSCKKYDKNGREIKDYDELEKANWLLGNWENETENGKLQEIWIVKNDSTFLGQSYFINKKDTIHNETIDLVEDKGVLKYVATIKGENQNLPTTFNFKETEENQLQFENPKHDYPSKILYKLKDSLNLDISISGKQLGKPSSENFKMVKVN
jgi:Domain of unknown function (DUF6265)